MTLDFRFFDAAAPAGVDGVFIPVGDLTGLADAELADGNDDRESKAVLALLTTMFEVLSPQGFDKLGIAVSKGNQSSPGADLVNQPFSFTATYWSNPQSAQTGLLPVPTGGDNADVGAFNIDDVFPNAAYLAAADNTPGAGILVRDFVISKYSFNDGGIGVTEDGRGWFAALAAAMVFESVLRSSADASAIVGVTRSNPAPILPPAAWTAAPNPITDLTAAHVAYSAFYAVTYSVTIQYLLDQAAQTFDVNHVTA